jgi:hypothetical protein
MFYWHKQIIKLASASGTVLIVATMLCMAETGYARIFKWTDANGQTHYSETALAGQATQELQTTPAPLTESSDAGDAGDKLMLQMEMEKQARKKNAEAMEKAVADRAEAERKAACARAQQVLNLLQRQERIFTKGQDGQRVYLEDDARAAAIERAKKTADSNCES